MAIKELRSKIETLVNKHERSLYEIKNLKMKNTELSDLITEQENVIRELTEQNKIGNLAEGLKSKGSNKEANLKINELVREIDKCLGQLNR